MNDTTNEQLSALMDGELPRDELRFLLRRIDGDASLAQRWSRYQIASAVLKRQYATPLSDGEFATVVMARLDAGTVAARQPMAERLLRWAGGGAIAASVAVLALVATRPAGTDGAMPATGAPAIATALAAPQPAPIMDMRQPLLPQQVSPAGFSDYAQPASFESIVPTYTYTPTYTPQPRQPRNPAVQSGNGLSEAFVPYVLVVGARQQPLEPQPQQRDAAAKQ
jgi:sigma-E factor negative regulatory protein RseA